MSGVMEAVIEEQGESALRRGEARLNPPKRVVPVLLKRPRAEFETYESRRNDGNSSTSAGTSTPSRSRRSGTAWWSHPPRSVVSHSRVPYVIRSRLERLLLTCARVTAERSGLTKPDVPGPVATSDAPADVQRLETACDALYDLSS